MEETYGIISLIPVAVVIIVAIWTKRCLGALLCGTFAAAIILYKGSWWAEWFSHTTGEIGTNAGYIIMFGFFGALIRLLDESGAAMGFADIGSKLANTRKKTLVFTWILGIIIFVEDYLNALGVGVAMKSLTDKNKISREYLSFVVNSTGAAVCVLVPFSTWGVLYTSQIKETGVITGMSPIAAYAHSIPFMLYSIIAVLVTFLFIMKIIPLFGPMKKAEERVLETGRVFPDWKYEGEAAEELETTTKACSAWNFIIPMIILIAVAIPTGDITLAVIIATVVSGLMLIVQKILTIGQVLDGIVNGFKDMLYVTMLVLIAFELATLNDELGLTPFVIDTVTPIMSPKLLPVIAFVVVAALAFATGSFWGVAAISFPIILPLAQALDVNLFLTVGTIAAATSFGSHACFYSDAVTVTCAATGIKNIDYARTSIPLIMVPFAIAIVAYLIVGIIMG